MSGLGSCLIVPISCSLRLPPFFLTLPPPPLPMHHFCIGVVYTAMSHTKVFEILHFHCFRTLCLWKPQCNTKLWKAELQTNHKTEGRVFCHQCRIQIWLLLLLLNTGHATTFQSRSHSLGWYRTRGITILNFLVPISDPSTEQLLSKMSISNGKNLV